MLMSLTSFSQLVVKEDSFQKTEDVFAIGKNVVSEDSDEAFALIKISTENIKNSKKIEFSNDEFERIYSKIKKSNISLYVPIERTKYIYISHPNYGEFEYHFPEKLCDSCTYEMILTYVTYTEDTLHVEEVVVEEKIPQNILTITTFPKKSSVYLDEEYKGVTPLMSRSIGILDLSVLALSSSCSIM